MVNVSGEVPIVAIDPHTGPADLPTVESDSFHGAQLATRYLIELGHTRIGFISGRPDLRSSALRDAGYRSALLEAGIRFDATLVGVGRYQEDASRELAHELLSHVRPSDGDLRRERPVGHCRAGASPPSWASRFPTSSQWSASTTSPRPPRHVPPLSTVRQPMQRLGEVATRMLIALMNGETPEQTHLRLPTRLVPRATTAPPL